MARAAHLWLPGYLRHVFQAGERCPGPRHLIFCVADHFEPFRGGASVDGARTAVQKWVADYREFSRGFRDADGRPPRHTFFYPAEEADPGCLRLLAELTAEGLAEVEIHLHHRHDTPEGLQSKLTQFRDRLRSEQGLLGTDTAGAVRYGFVHGNWALCNSRPDGDWCGVDAELGILSRTGCYADFTFPSAPSPTQPRMVNALYYARDRPGRPRSADRGERVRAEEYANRWPDNGTGPCGRFRDPSGGALMIVQGPLALNWQRRKWGVLPRLENSEIGAAAPPTRDRMELWVRQAIHVTGCPEWVFVKIHTHGCLPVNRAVVLGNAMRQAHSFLQTRFNDRTRWMLHYVTAREMYNLIRAAEGGQRENPCPWRDCEIQPPPICRNRG